MDDFEKKLRACFCEEAAQALQDLEQCLLILENDPKNERNLQEIFRFAHNLKGSSQSAGITTVSKIAHEFESLMIQIKNGRIEVQVDTVDIFLRAKDILSAIIESLKSEQPVTIDSVTLIEDLIYLQRPSERKEVEKNLVENFYNLPPPRESQDEQKVSLTDQSVRVALSKVETLINYVGEMVIIQSVLNEQALRSDSLELRKTVHLLGKVTKELQDISMGLRMVTIKPTFQKMSRIVRDTAAMLDKEVTLKLVGEETELDKMVLDRISDPLTHLIRNSVDHGIESQEVREKKKKPRVGQIFLKASHQSGNLQIEVSDDGGGMDPQKLIAKAIEKGLLRPGTQLSDSEAYQLIFTPGFSTKEEITEISGRGVGMDVVKSNISELSGEIFVRSKVGEGTSFQITLPLTLAIIESLIVTYSGQKFVLPLSHVHETVSVKDYQSQTVTGIGEVLLFRGENLKIARVGDFLGIKSQKPTSEMIGVIVRNGPTPFCILVDDILGQRQVVVKQLSRELSGFVGISGTTILGDGKPALILELTDLCKRKIKSCYEPAKRPHTGEKSA